MDVNCSGWNCRWENRGVRMGMRYVKGLREVNGKAIEEGAQARRRAGAQAGFESVDDLAVRCNLRDDQLTKLAYSGALASLGLRRRAALWQAAEAARPAGELFASAPARQRASAPLVEMTIGEETLADYDRIQLTTGPHLIQHFREQLNATAWYRRAISRDSERMARLPVRSSRQRPGPPRFVFLTRKTDGDVAGDRQPAAVQRPAVDHRQLAGSDRRGILQGTDGQCSVKAEKFWPLDGMSEVASHDFH